MPLSVLSADISQVHAHLISLIRSWSRRKERYADLRSQARTRAAREFVRRILQDIEEREQQASRRVRKRRARSGIKFEDALERFIGDLLRVRAGATGPALVYRPTGKDHFDFDPVKYDVFQGVLWGLRELELVQQWKGYSRYRKIEFDPGDFASLTLAGHASRFRATEKLTQLAEQYGINSENIDKHFAPEPPQHPLVLKDYATGRGRNKESGRRLKYKLAPKIERLEKDVRELNNFLAGCNITGGRHEGYTRVFNNGSWKKGGRLYSIGEDSYQRMDEGDRVKMTINGEPVAEIDIKASFLTIYHAMVGEPLQGSGDPYARVGIDRDIAKLWVVASMGNTKPATRWPPEMSDEYRRDTGRDLGKQAKAADLARKMLAAFPALKKLEDHSDIWADLQYQEAEAVIGTMLILMRQHGVPSLSMHDGIIVPTSQADLTEHVLKQEFRRVVGVEPTLTVDTYEPAEVITDL